jgi:NADH-quinone oxidoreductase subunit F
MPNKITTVLQLNALRDKAKLDVEMRFGPAPRRPDAARTHVVICAGAGCVASGSLDVGAAFRSELKRRELEKEIAVVETGCLGPCMGGPVVMVYPEGIFYEAVKPAAVPQIVEEHLVRGRVVESLLHRDPGEGKPIPKLQDIAFFRKQVKLVLRNCGRIDPLRVEEYIARDGYQALAKCLGGLAPDRVIEEVKRSGLRGRGGAGFLTGLKWSLTRKAKGEVKYVLCNADEGDPGAFMDRSVLEGDPHSVIEGMAIAAYAVGASQGYVYVRAEYPLAVERLQKAIEHARAHGLLGEGILGTPFNFDLEIRMGSGAFVCGEETALMTSIEGHRGEPRPRPPFPAQSGLWAKPSLLNNVETYANVPLILLNGAEEFARLGTEKSKGTKVFALAGAVTNTGLVEVPIGTPLGEIIYDIGGGVPDGKKFKAAQIGGPSGGCIPKEHLNVPVDYESLTELGAIMGSGGLVVMDEDSCMVDVARYFLDFVQDESCGKCAPCRIGTKRMLEIVTRICEGKGEMSDLDKLQELGAKIKDTALCGLGQTAPNPVLSTLRHFRDEYVAHIRDRHCPAGTCASLVRASCQSACPAGVHVPGFVSLIGEKRYAEALRVHREKNPFASVCARVCFHTCESKCRRSSLDNSVAIRGLKRFMVEQEVTLQLPEIRENDDNARRKVAIIGAGPAGLSCAYFLGRLGYRPKVFEASRRPGGMLVQTIPAYRLPREEVAREVRMIERMGVEIETEKALGRDFSLGDLQQQGYEAVFVALGAPDGVRLGVPGEDIEGVTEAIFFLRDYNIRGSVPVGKNVVVIGGGNAAMDAARTALRLGAETVTILYRRTHAEMPAYKEEVEEAEREGVRIECLVAPVEIVGRAGKVAGVKCRHMQLGEFDRSGRRRPVAETSGDYLVEADQVIVAIGQQLNPEKVFQGQPLALNTGKFLDANPVSMQTSVPWIFAGGDVVTGPFSVVEAVASGEKAAVGMDRFLTGESHAFWRDEQDVDTFFDPEADPVQTPRADMRLIPVARRRNNFSEVELPFTESVALHEAKRCLRCDYRGEQAPSKETQHA